LPITSEVMETGTERHFNRIFIHEIDSLLNKPM